jgi:hypothetical protein
MRDGRKVNLFVVGMTKTGTTALHGYFNEHTDIYAQHKEPYYFAQELIRAKFKDKNKREYFLSTFEDYIKYYSNVKDEKVIADMTPSYLFSKEAAKRIYDYNPEAKIIAILREPVDWLRSAHAYRIYSLGENEKNLLKALDLEEERKKNDSDPYLFYSEWVKYSEHLKRYTDLFPKENIKVIIYERYLSNNIKILNEIADFLEIDHFEHIDIKKINTSKASRLIFIKKLVWKFPRIIAFLKKNLGKKVFGIITDFYVKLTTKKASKPEISEETISMLKKRYKRNVVDFENLLKENDFIEQDFDLIKYWGYDNL